MVGVGPTIIHPEMNHLRNPAERPSLAGSRFRGEISMLRNAVKGRIAMFYAGITLNCYSDEEMADLRRRKVI